MYIKAFRAFVNPLNKISTLTPGEKQDKNICLCNHLAIHLSFCFLVPVLNFYFQTSWHSFNLFAL